MESTTRKFCVSKLSNLIDFVDETIENPHRDIIILDLEEIIEKLEKE